jgi:peptidoglycan DL-endopeptidase CwlO
MGADGRDSVIALRRPTALAAALLAAVLLAVTGVTPRAFAAPNTDSEGGTAALRKALDQAARAYGQAKAKLDASKKRQVQYAGQLKAAEQRLTELRAHVQELAATAYRSGRLTPFLTLLNSASPEDFLQRAITVDMLAKQDDQQLRDYAQAQADAVEQKALVDNEVRIQTKQLADMAKRKKQAEQALIAAGGGRSTSSLASFNSPAAKPAPRNSDGSWPSESCSVDDPTTSGCITPRTAHMYSETKADGFNHYVSCYRSGGGGEHPKGRACDWAAASGGFENVNATGSDKTYGDRLAAYFLKNADALGIMYVIWYGRIWMPSTGWRTYSGCCGPAETHKNHVHVSML